MFHLCSAALRLVAVAALALSQPGGVAIAAPTPPTAARTADPLLSSAAAAAAAPFSIARIAFPEDVDGPGVAVAVGETVILLHPPLPLVGNSIAMEREHQQNDGRANG